MSVPVTNDVTLTWQWQLEYQFIVTSAGNGTIRQNAGWVEAGGEAVAEAIPAAGYVFARWLGALPGEATNNPLVRVLDGPLSLTAQSEPAAGLAGWLARYGLTLEEQEADTDGDGFTNAQEYLADTNPTNALSYLRPLEIEVTEAGVRLVQRETSTNRTYGIWSRRAWDEPWLERTNAVGTGTNAVFELPRAVEAEFFRSGAGLGRGEGGRVC